METIFGIATVLGKSGVAVVRVSGVNAVRVFAHFCVEVPEPRYAAFAKLKRGEEIIDEAVIIYFKSPASFTGEDVVELHTHGSRAVINRLIAELSSLKNFRLAEAGEFSRRAFLNDKMDLTEAEGLADLIDAETAMQAKQAMRQMQGQLGKIYDSWRDEMVSLLSRIEAYIDFPDEDLPKELVEIIAEQISNFKSSILNHLNDGKRGEKIREGIYVVILGAPNVGKSSLLNYLAKRDAAIVSDIAGTTRDVIEVHLEIAGLPVIIADTAGIRETADAVESEGVRRALQRAESADIKIIMVEAGAEAAKIPADENSILVINKIDKGQSSKVKALGISVKTGEGVENLWKTLEQKIAEKYSLSEAPLITRARHREALEKTLAALESFSLEKPIELVAEDLRYAAASLGSITGKIDVEDILDKIFSSFCIGK